MKIWRRFQDVAGVALMGDAGIHLLSGSDHFRLWETPGESTSAYNRGLEYMAGHRWARALVSAGEFAVGLALARSAERPAGAPG